MAIGKHWVGFHDISQMEKPGYFETWINVVGREEDNGNEVLVFSIPKGIGLPEKIEIFIQDEVEKYQITQQENYGKLDNM